MSFLDFNWLTQATTQNYTRLGGLNSKHFSHYGRLQSPRSRSVRLHILWLSEICLLPFSPGVHNERLKWDGANPGVSCY